MNKKLFALIILLFSLYACSDETADFDANQTVRHEKTPVKIMLVKKENFYKELYSNGIIESTEMAELKFNTNGQIAELYIKEGQRVKKGEILAVLDLTNKALELQKAKIQLANAQNNYETLLLGQGYELKDSTKIPSETLEKAKIKSSLSTERLNLKDAERNLQSSYLRAPFSGVIANIKAKKYAYINSSDEICTLINDAKYEVSFPVFETEADQISLGKTVEIISLSKDTLQASVTQINPVVSKGQFMVRARLTNARKSIMAGMSVKIIVKSPLGKKLVVPRTAVVIRQNRDVVFTVKNGKAAWNYVTTGAENKNQYTIEQGLNAGDTVIISNNISLAHDTELSIEKPETQQ